MIIRDKNTQEKIEYKYSKEKKSGSFIFTNENLEQIVLTFSQDGNIIVSFDSEINPLEDNDKEGFIIETDNSGEKEEAILKILLNIKSNELKEKSKEILF